jgi:hypothetical protein
MPLEFERVALENKRNFIALTNYNPISGTTEHDYLLLKNPSDTEARLFVSHPVFAVDATVSRCMLRIYHTPTITDDGTALSEESTYIGASPPVAQGEAFRDPTISARGTLLDNPLIPADSPSRGLNRFYILDPGFNMLFTVQNNISNASTSVSVFWMELNL